MIKLRFSAPVFNTYCDGKITVCQYECNLIDTERGIVLMNFKVSGKASCSPMDTIDPVKGKILADSRAKYAAYRKAYKAITPTFLALKSEFTKYQNAYDQLVRLVFKEAHHVAVVSE